MLQYSDRIKIKLVLKLMKIFNIIIFLKYKKDEIYNNYHI